MKLSMIMITFILRDWMSSIENGIASLNVQQIQLDGIFRIDVLIGEEEFSFQ